MAAKTTGFDLLCKSPHLAEVGKILRVPPDTARLCLREGSLERFTVERLKAFGRYIDKIDPISACRLKGNKAAIVNTLRQYLRSPVTSYHGVIDARQLAGSSSSSSSTSSRGSQADFGALRQELAVFLDKQGPFYEHVDTIYIGRGSSTHSTNDFNVTSKTLEQLKSKDHLIHVRAFNLQQKRDDEWDYLINVNQKPVDATEHSKKPKTKAFKNNPKYCSCLPVNITTAIQPSWNQIKAVWKTSADRLVVVQLVRKCVQDKLVEEVVQRQKRASSVEKGNSEVEELSSEVSLICPLSYSRIKIPVKGDNCHHVTCFDLESILNYAKDLHMWVCPICSSPVPYKSLHVDSFMSSVLKGTSESDVRVSMKPDGSWAAKEPLQKLENPRPSKRRRTEEVVTLDSDSENETDECESGSDSSPASVSTPVRNDPGVVTIRPPQSPNPNPTPTPTPRRAAPAVIIIE